MYTCRARKAGTLPGYSITCTYAMATTSPIKIGLVGLGKIAVDQHIPAIRNLSLIHI